jgi:hypothetical protein
METKQQYLNYIQDQLKTIDRSQAIASYDTGYGLHIVDTYLGDEVHSGDVRAHSILRLRSPNIEGEAWYEAWSAGCKLVSDFCKGVDHVN